jgi:hypothetical protein
MQQTIVSVVLPVPSGQVQALQDAIDALHRKLSPGDYATLRAALPTLHFMSIMLFDASAGVPRGDIPVTPLFVLEANLDGAPGPFWAALEAAVGEDLRGLLRLCAAPRGRWDNMFQSITAPGARAPLAPLLERQSVFPAASHAGVRGLSRDRVLRHAALFQAAQASLPPPPDVLAAGAPAIHQWLRARLLPENAWLDSGWEAPISAGDHAADTRNVWLFFGLTAAAAVAPWLALTFLLRRLLPQADAAADVAGLAFLAGVACTTQLRDMGDLLTLLGRAAVPQLWWMMAEVLLFAAVVPLFAVRGGALAPALLGAGGVLASALGLLALLRRRERADAPPADAVPDPATVHALQDWEDRHIAGADHMGSVVIIKPGRFRAFLLRFGMTALNLVVRMTATDGYLGSMRTIHFAHWAIVDGGQRLLFLSNFDGSWESYLDDFIEKAHAGLTLAWGNCVGFPPARYLTLDGATQGRKFKNWARCSMAQSRFWYAAYPDLTVNQIWRQARLAQGLAATSLAPAQAALWARDL